MTKRMESHRPGSIRRSLPLFGSLAAGAFATVGNAVALFVLPWFVLTLTGSAVWTGLAAAAGVAPMIVGALIGGGLVDRFGPRRIAASGDLLSALAVGAVPLLYQADALNIGGLIALIALGAAMDGPAAIAAESRHPELARLAGIRLERIKAIDELIENAGALIGPAAAGAAIAMFGMQSALWMTAGCSLVAAILDVISLPTRRRSGGLNEPAIGLDGVREALGFLRKDQLIPSLIVLGTLFGAVFGALQAVVMPAFFKEAGQSVVDLGLLLSATATGAIGGTIAYSVWGARLGNRSMLLVGCAVQTVTIFSLSFMPPTPILLAVGAVAGMAIGPIAPIVATATLRRVPARLRGRVLGVTEAFELAAIPFGLVLAGVAVEAFGASILLVSTAAALGVLTLVAMFLPALALLDAKPKKTGVPSSALQRDGV